MKFVWLSTVLTLSTLIAATASASPFDCSTEIDGKKLNAVVTIGNTSTSTLTYDGDAVPALGNCFEMERPSTRFLRCSHQIGDLRIEIYPWVESSSGSLRSMEVVIWHGGRAQRGAFDCKSAL